MSYSYLSLTNRPFRAQEASAAIDVCSGITLACSVHVAPANKLSTGCIRCSPSFWSAKIYCSTFWSNILSVVECWINGKAVSCYTLMRRISTVKFMHTLCRRHPANPNYAVNSRRARIRYQMLCVWRTTRNVTNYNNVSIWFICGQFLMQFFVLTL